MTDGWRKLDVPIPVWERYQEYCATHGLSPDLRPWELLSIVMTRLEDFERIDRKAQLDARS